MRKINQGTIVSGQTEIETVVTVIRMGCHVALVMMDIYEKI